MSRPKGRGKRMGISLNAKQLHLISELANEHGLITVQDVIRFLLSDEYRARKVDQDGCLKP